MLMVCKISNYYLLQNKERDILFLAYGQILDCDIAISEKNVRGTRFLNICNVPNL